MLIPLLLTLISLAIIIFIIARKLPQLSLLDVETLPEVRQGKTKDILLKKRAEKHAQEASVKMKEKLKPLVRFFAHVQREFRNYVTKVQRTVHHEARRMRKQQLAEKGDTEKIIEPVEPVKVNRSEREELLQGAQVDVAQENYIEAEKKCIAIIKQDPQYVEAYQILASVYVKQNQIPEAEQTYEFILQLDPRNESAYVHLAEIAEERGELHKAVDYYQEALLINDSVSTRFAKIYDLLMQLEEFSTALEAAKQAVALEPENPHYLDNLVETSIIVGDKNLAESTFERLRMVNPENKKIEAFRQRIKNLH